MTLTGKNNERFIRSSVEAQSKLIEKWEATQDADFNNYITFQAMPTLLFENSFEQGGNDIGMDHEEDNAILFQMQQVLRIVDQEEDARRELIAIREELKEHFVFAGVNVEWEYLGYADGFQDPLRTMGQGNIQLMKDVAAKYDPEQVFQQRVAGGFKISDVA